MKSRIQIDYESSRNVFNQKIQLYLITFLCLSITYVNKNSPCVFVRCYLPKREIYSIEFCRTLFFVEQSTHPIIFSSIAICKYLSSSIISILSLFTRFMLLREIVKLLFPLPI